MSSGADVLNAAALLAAAKAETGLSDFGDDSLPARFAEFVSYLERFGLPIEQRH